VGDAANEYDRISIAHPELQRHSITIEQGVNLIQNLIED